MGLYLELSEKSIFVLPVRIDDCKIPITVHDRKYADFRQSFKAGMDDLLDAIQSPVPMAEADSEGTMVTLVDAVSLVDLLSKLPEEAVKERIADLSIPDKRKVIAEAMDRFAFANLEDSSSMRSSSLLYVLDYAAREAGRPSAKLFETLFGEIAYRTLPYFRIDMLRLMARHVGSSAVRDWIRGQGLVDWFVERFEKSLSFAEGGVNSEIVASLEPILAKNDLKRIANAALVNDQIYLSYGAPEPLRRLFSLHDKWLSEVQKQRLKERSLR